MPKRVTTTLAFKRVLLAFDNGANGAEEATEFLPALRSFGGKVARLSPRREDGQEKSNWNAMFLQHGTEVLRAWLPARIALIRHIQFGE